MFLCSLHTTGKLGQPAGPTKHSARRGSPAWASVSTAPTDRRGRPHHRLTTGTDKTRTPACGETPTLCERGWLSSLHLERREGIPFSFSKASCWYYCSILKSGGNLRTHMDTFAHFPITDSVKMMEPVAKTNFHLSILLSTQSLRVHGAPKRTGGRGGRARRKHGS